MPDPPHPRRRPSPAGAVVALVAVLVTGMWAATAGAGAETVSAEQLEALAEQARRDPAALRRLRQVDTVDGRPTDLGRALAGAEGEALDARLRALAGGGDGGGRGATGAGRGPRAGAGDTAGAGSVAPAPPAAEARAEARRILAQRRFRPARTPRPLRGVLRRLGGWIRPVAEPIGRLWDDVAGSVLGRLMVVIAVIGLAALATIRLVRRRNAAGVAPGSRPHRRRQEDPAELERRADRAERQGDLALAFRLRFRAGLLRLDGAGLVPYRPSLTTGQLTDTVRSPTFRALATAFDEIAYGGRPAGPDDLETARAGWPRVLQNPELGEQSGARAPLSGTASDPDRRPGRRGGATAPLR